MLILTNKMTNAEIYERTYPFFNLQIGDIFEYDLDPYIRVPRSEYDIEIYDKTYHVTANAVSLYDGRLKNFKNEDLVVIIDNPFRRTQLGDEI